MSTIHTRHFRRAATKGGPVRVIDADTGELLATQKPYTPAEVRRITAEPRYRSAVCSYCGKPNLRWHTTSTGRFLYERESAPGIAARRHRCP